MVLDTHEQKAQKMWKKKRLKTQVIKNKDNPSLEVTYSCVVNLKINKYINYGVKTHM